jgi:hypothetical protein
MTNSRAVSSGVAKRRNRRSLLAAGFTAGIGGVLILLSVTVAHAAEPAVELGTASSFSGLGGSTVTNTGPSVLGGDLGVSPGTAITGFPPGVVLAAVHVNDAVALQAQSDLTTAYNDAAGRAPTASAGTDLGGATLIGGVYNASSSLGLTGTVTLDAQGDPGAVFIFQIGSTLITASNSTVSLINGADPCNVFWQVGSSATLGTGTAFVGTMMALTSVTVTTGATVQGRALARNGALTLDSNTITTPTCADSGGSTTVPVTSGSESSATESSSSVPTETSTDTSTASTSPGTPTDTDTGTGTSETDTLAQTTTTDRTTPAAAQPFDGPHLATTGSSPLTLAILGLGTSLVGLGALTIWLAKKRTGRLGH